LTVDGTVLDSVENQPPKQFGNGTNAFINRHSLINMKLTTFAFATIAVALGVWNANAQPIPGGYSRFERINFSLVIRQQESGHWGITSGIWTVKTMRMGNKELLKYLAEAFHTTWPAGARLAVLTDIRDWFPYPDYQRIYVLDKDGNVLSDGNWGFYLNETNNAYFRINWRSPLRAGKYLNTGWSLESDDATHFRILSFQLYRIEDDPLVYTDLQFQGFDAQVYHQESSYNTNRISMSDKANLSGDGLMSNTWTVVNGQVTIAGKWVDVF